MQRPSTWLPVFTALILPITAGAVDFAADIKPIFQEHCSDCRGVDEQKSKLRLDHERLSYYHNGIERRLTNVHGHVVKDMLA